MLFDTSINTEDVVEEGLIGATVVILGLGFLALSTIGRDRDKNGKYKDKIVKQWESRYDENVTQGKYNRPLKYIEEISHCGYTVDDINNLVKSKEVKGRHSYEIASEIDRFNETIWYANDDGDKEYAKEVEKLKTEFQKEFANRVTVIIDNGNYIIGWTGSGVIIYNPETHAENKLLVSKVSSFDKLLADSKEACTGKV